MTDRKPNEAGLRANDPVDRIDLPPEVVDTEDRRDGPASAASPTPPKPRSEGAEMAPEIDDVDGGEETA